MLYEEEQEAEQARQAEKAARGDKRGPQIDSRGRPVMPRWPMLTRTLPFMFSGGVLIRWGVLSFGVYCIVGIALLGLVMASQGGFGAIGGLSFYAMGLILFAIWLAAASAIMVTVVTESSEGVDRIERWPASMMNEWLGELVYVLVAALVSPLPGWLIGRYGVEDSFVRVLWFMGSMLVFFPIILLSQLDIGSPFGVASARVVGSLLRLPASWIIFYAEIAVLAAACIASTIILEQISPVLELLLIPLYVGALLIAARLLGRLGWKLAESMPQSAES
jgi:hypothetical protein